MRTAKQLFQSTPSFKDFRAILENPAFEHACAAALASFAESLPRSPDPSKGWDAHSQYIGAQAVLESLSRLHEPDEQPKHEKSPELKYNLASPKYRP